MTKHNDRATPNNVRRKEAQAISYMNFVCMTGEPLYRAAGSGSLREGVRVFFLRWLEMAESRLLDIDEGAKE